MLFHIEIETYFSFRGTIMMYTPIGQAPRQTFMKSRLLVLTDAVEPVGPRAIEHIVTHCPASGAVAKFLLPALRAWRDETDPTVERHKTYHELMTMIEAEQTAEKVSWAQLGLAERAEERLWSAIAAAQTHGRHLVLSRFRNAHGTAQIVNLWRCIYRVRSQTPQ
jgi:hypothetical protein